MAHTQNCIDAVVSHLRVQTNFDEKDKTKNSNG
jgi:hypothetical protein